MRMLANRKTFIVGAILVALTWAAQAFVVDALSYALEGAEKYVSKKGGYNLRKDFWQGASPSGEAQAVKHQLTAGNSYWFWVGTDSDDVTMAVAIYDKKKRTAPKKDGKPYVKEVKKGKRWIGARVEVPKSGTYLIAFKITTKDKSEAHWAVAYAYK